MPEPVGAAHLSVHEAAAGRPLLDAGEPANRDAVERQAVLDESARAHLDRPGVSTRKPSQGGVIASRLRASAKNANTSSGGAGTCCSRCQQVHLHRGTTARVRPIGPPGSVRRACEEGRAHVLVAVLGHALRRAGGGWSPRAAGRDRGAPRPPRPARRPWPRAPGGTRGRSCARPSPRPWCAGTRCRAGHPRRPRGTARGRGRGPPPARSSRRFPRARTGSMCSRPASGACRCRPRRATSCAAPLRRTAGRAARAPRRGLRRAPPACPAPPAAWCPAPGRRRRSGRDPRPAERTPRCRPGRWCSSEPRRPRREPPRERRPRRSRTRARPRCR